MHISIFCLATLLTAAPTEEAFQSSTTTGDIVTTQSTSTTTVTRKPKKAIPLSQKLGRYQLRERSKPIPTTPLETSPPPSLDLSPQGPIFAPFGNAKQNPKRNQNRRTAATIPHRTNAPPGNRVARRTLPYQRPYQRPLQNRQRPRLPGQQNRPAPFRLTSNPLRLALLPFLSPRPAPAEPFKDMEATGPGPSGMPGYGGMPGQREIFTACPEFWVHRHALYFGSLYLSARGTDTRYTTPVDGLGGTAVPVGSTGVADPTYRRGYQLGATFSLSEKSSLTANYATFNSHTSDSVSLPGGGSNYLRSDVTHPNTTNVAADSLSARAGYDVDFKNFDFNYQAKFHQGERHTLNYLVGMRYGHLNQDLSTVFSIVGNTTVDSDIDFHGVGPRIGVNGKRMLGKRGLYLYGRSSANFLLGSFEANFLQQNIAGGVQAATGYEEDRIVPVTELELGIGWKSQCGRFSWRGGYYVGAWFNSITTPTFIDAVQQDRFQDMDESVTFDGIATRLEIQL